LVNSFSMFIPHLVQHTKFLLNFHYIRICQIYLFNFLP
jgi:hypothetical protein